MQESIIPKELDIEALLPRMRQSPYVVGLGLQALALRLEAIFEIPSGELDELASLELNAHIVLYRKRGYKVRVKQVSEGIPSEYACFVESYRRGKLEHRLGLKIPEVSSAKTK